MASDAQPPSKQRVVEKQFLDPGISRDSQKATRALYQNATLPMECVVCGDRACSHHYYGVAACHGCKCFFWRSVKGNAKYVCRYDSNCAINVNGRNSCRYCRFNRCLQAGMKPEAVRIEKQRIMEQILSAGAKMKRCQRALDITADYTLKTIDDVNMTKTVSIRKEQSENYALMDSLIQTERIVTEGVHDMWHLQTASNLRDAFCNPPKLDADRTPIVYGQTQIEFRNESEKSGRRMLVAAIDWIRLMLNVHELLTVDDKVSLLRSCYAALTVFELCVRTTKINCDRSILCLPNGYAIPRDGVNIPRSFMSVKLIRSMIDTLVKPLHMQQLNEFEIVMFKAIIILNPDANGLSTTAVKVVSMLRDRVHAALYQHCTEHYTNVLATMRFAELFHLLPKITTLAGQLEDHIQLSHTFCKTVPRDDLLYELLGDIFDSNCDTFDNCARSNDSTSSTEFSEQKLSDTLKSSLESS